MSLYYGKEYYSQNMNIQRVGMAKQAISFFLRIRDIRSLKNVILYAILSMFKYAWFAEELNNQ